MPPRVGDGATIGANAVLVAPVCVGASAVIAAGAVVTKDVPPHAIVAGSSAPARSAEGVYLRGDRRALRAQTEAGLLRSLQPHLRGRGCSGRRAQWGSGPPRSVEASMTSRITIIATWA